MKEFLKAAMPLLIWVVIIVGLSIFLVHETRRCNARGGAYVGYQCIKAEIIRL